MKESLLQMISLFKFGSFLDAPSHLYKRVCPSIRPSVVSESITRTTLYKNLVYKNVEAQILEKIRTS